MMRWHFRLPQKLVDREKLILDLCKDRRVLHIGFVDFPLLDYRMETGTWLHWKIMKVAREVVGIDNAEKEVDRIRREYHLDNIFCCDAEKMDEINGAPFDVIVAGEIIEHLTNPGLFLDSIRPLITEGGILIITTTNAYSARRFIRVVFGTESIHPDHMCYFSHSTLTALLQRHGYKIRERLNYRLPKKPPWFPYSLELISTLISPNLSEGIIYLASK